MNKKFNFIISFIMTIIILGSTELSVLASEVLSDETVIEYSESNEVMPTETSGEEYVLDGKEGELEQEQINITGAELLEQAGMPIENIMDFNDMQAMLVDNEIEVMSEDIPENTNPNYAYAVETNTAYRGTFTATSEIRWYAFDINETSKISIYMQMASDLDADIYMFQLDTATMQLNQLSMMSATSGSGVTEYYTYKMDAGVYYIALYSRMGTGAYSFAFFESTKYIKWEIDDTIDRATQTTPNMSYTGVLDTFVDTDYYYFTIDNPVLTEWRLISSFDYISSYRGCTQGGKVYSMGDSVYLFGPGTYFFSVSSPSGTFSPVGEYILQFSSITRDIANDMEATNITYWPETSTVFQSNSDGSKCYVNTHPIENCKFSYKISRGSGDNYCDFVMELESKGNMKYSDPTVLKNVYSPIAKDKGIEQGKFNSVIALTLSSDEKIYSSTNDGYFLPTSTYPSVARNNVRVYINTTTGKVVDIATCNYLYTSGARDDNPFSGTIVNSNIQFCVE